jgi:hypothetical protein
MRHFPARRQPRRQGKEAPGRGAGGGTCGAGSPSPFPQNRHSTNHPTCLTSCETLQAHYFCACMNSSPARGVIVHYSSQSTGSFGSPHILEHTRIPKFDGQARLHKLLADLSRRAHIAAARKKAADVADIESQIDEAAAKLWGLAPRELSVIQRALRTQRGMAPLSDDATDELLLVE